MLKHLALISMIIFSIVALSIVIKFKHQKHLTISLHVAKTKLTATIFGITDVSFALSWLAFIYGWFGPHFQLSPIFYILATIVFLLLIVVGIFPHMQTSHGQKIHQFCAWRMIYFMIPAAIDIFVETFPSAHIITIIFQIIYLLFTITMILINKFHKKYLRAHILYFESAYVFGFFTVFLLLTYL